MRLARGQREASLFFLLRNSVIAKVVISRIVHNLRQGMEDEGSAAPVAALGSVCLPLRCEGRGVRFPGDLDRRHFVRCERRRQEPLLLRIRH